MPPTGSQDNVADDQLSRTSSLEAVVQAATPRRSALQQRRRETTRLEIAEAAVRLFVAQGFEATTVEQIAAEADISLRTFYRYCDSKDDALTPVLVTGGDRFVACVVAAPAEVPLAGVLVSAAIEVMEDQDHSHLRRHASMVMLTTPALRPRWLDLIRHWQEQMAPALASRFGWPPDGLEATAMAALVASAVNSAVEYSLHSDVPLAESVARSVAMLETGLAAIDPPARG
jgi:AcrR family transcriptional regulator